MKRLLIISEHDAVERQLFDLVSHMFADELKEVFLCNIEIIPLETPRTIAPEIRINTIGRGINQNINVSIQHLKQTPIKEILHADCCEEIDAIVRDKEIDYVVLPFYSENNINNSYFTFIAQDIKRHTSAQVVGLLV